MLIKHFYRLQRARLAAAPLTLRPVLGWKSKVLGVVSLLVLALLLLVVGGWLGWREADDAHRLGLSGQAERIVQLDKALASEVAARRMAEQQLAVERATRETLARDLASTQSEAAARQEALVFLDSLLTANDRTRAVRFVACELQAMDNHKFRYRALLAQGINSAADFNGRLLVTVDYQQRGQRARHVLGQDKPLEVRVRHYERMEGELSLPAEAAPQALDIRVLSPDGRQVVAQCQKKTGGV